ACGNFVSFTHGIGLSFSFLLANLNIVAVSVFFLNLLDLLPGVVGAVPLNKDHLCVFPEFWQLKDGVFYVSTFVARRNDHGGGVFIIVVRRIVLGKWFCKTINVEAEKPETGKFGQVTI